MRIISKFIVEHTKLILIIGLLLLVPAIYGFINTRINYDILIYLPDSVDTIKGQKILTDEFGLGSYAFVMVEDKTNKEILDLENKFKKVPDVKKVISVADLLDSGVPASMLPNEIQDKLYKDNQTIIMISFKGATSQDETIEAVKSLRNIVEADSISSMTAMVLDTMNLANEEIAAYVIIAVILCMIALIITTDSYLIPIFLLLNIGIAIIYNLGSNIFLGQISYITKAITAILQLGVTTDFSIFLYHTYNIEKKKNKDKKESMKKAIESTFTSVIGSSLTTIAGFLALCTMSLTLGKDIGIVMAKGVVFGLITVLTIFPALLLLFDNLIERTKHRILLPEFKSIQKLALNKRKTILTLFIILLIPVLYGYKNYNVYYKLDESLPKSLSFNIANENLKDKYNIVSPQIILMDKSIKKNDIKEMSEELRNIKGIDLVLSPSEFIDSGLISILPDSFNEMFTNDKYNLVFINSTYEIASNDLNNQLDKVNKIVKKYDKNSIVAGEGALMKDLVRIANHDFKSVNYTSMIVIFIIMLFVLKSLSLPFILILAIEFAIFTNMACAYYMGTSLPFISSIVVGTIQLGATIDYAILMSTRYLEQRKKYKDKEKAMEKTLSLVTPSIITSALCFFSATIGVGVFTKIDMIGSICNLLARGSIISMLVVLIILPSLLITFDSLIIKTTKNMKEEKL